MDFFFPWPKELRVGRGCFQYTAVASAAILLTMNAQPCAPWLSRTRHPWSHSCSSSRAGWTQQCRGSPSRMRWASRYLPTPFPDSLTLPQTHTHSLSPSHTLSPSLSLSLYHTHTHKHPGYALLAARHSLRGPGHLCRSGWTRYRWGRARARSPSARCPLPPRPAPGSSCRFI